MKQQISISEYGYEKPISFVANVVIDGNDYVEYKNQGEGHYALAIKTSRNYVLTLNEK